MVVKTKVHEIKNVSLVYNIEFASCAILWLVCCFVQWFSYVLFLLLEQCCCKKQQKSPRQETGFGDRGSLKVLNDTKLVLSDPLNHLRSIWYHSEPSGVPYSPNQFLALDFFLSFLTARQL